ncbi:MAG: hypothetical protein MHPSP_000805, partial [Paramarteilia canceri]
TNEQSKKSLHSINRRVQEATRSLKVASESFSHLQSILEKHIDLFCVSAEASPIMIECQHALSSLSDIANGLSLKSDTINNTFTQSFFAVRSAESQTKLSILQQSLKSYQIASKNMKHQIGRCSKMQQSSDPSSLMEYINQSEKIFEQQTNEISDKIFTYKQEELLIWYNKIRQIIKGFSNVENNISKKWKVDLMRTIREDETDDLNTSIPDFISSKINTKGSGIILASSLPRPLLNEMKLKMRSLSAKSFNARDCKSECGYLNNNEIRNFSRIVPSISNLPLVKSPILYSNGNELQNKEKTPTTYPKISKSISENADHLTISPISGNKTSRINSELDKIVLDDIDNTENTIDKSICVGDDDEKSIEAFATLSFCGPEDQDGKNCSEVSDDKDSINANLVNYVVKLLLLLFLENIKNTALYLVLK